MSTAAVDLLRSALKGTFDPMDIRLSSVGNLAPGSPERARAALACGQELNGSVWNSGSSQFWLDLHQALKSDAPMQAFSRPAGDLFPEDIRSIRQSAERRKGGASDTVAALFGEIDAVFSARG